MFKTVEIPVNSLAKVGKIEAKNSVFDNSIKVVIFVDKKFCNSPEQLNWIKRAKHQSFTNVNITALFIKSKQKSPVIPPMKSFSDHRWNIYQHRRHCDKRKHYTANKHCHPSAHNHNHHHHHHHHDEKYHPHHRRNITDEEFYNILKANKNIDNVFMINNHFDLNLPLSYLNQNKLIFDRMTGSHAQTPQKTYFYLTNNDVNELYNYYIPYFNVDPSLFCDYGIGFNIDLSKLNTTATSSSNNSQPVVDNGNIPLFYNNIPQIQPIPKPPAKLIPHEAFRSVFCNTFIVPKYHLDSDNNDDDDDDDDDDEDDDDDDYIDDDDDDSSYERHCPRKCVHFKKMKKVEEEEDYDDDEGDDDDDDSDDDSDDDDSDDDSEEERVCGIVAEKKKQCNKKKQQTKQKATKPATQTQQQSPFTNLFTPSQPFDLKDVQKQWETAFPPLTAAPVTDTEKWVEFNQKWRDVGSKWVDDLVNTVVKK